MLKPKVKSIRIEIKLVSRSGSVFSYNLPQYKNNP